MKSKVIVELIEIDEFTGQQSVVEVFDYRHGFHSADIAEKARVECADLNAAAEGTSLRYVTNRID